MELLKNAILDGSDISADERISKHAEWAEMIKEKYEITEENCMEILQKEIGIVFAAILQQCGVFERTEEGQKQFVKFLNSVL